jgi:glutamyl-tRNA synthetase
LKARIKEIAAGAQGAGNPAKELYHYLRKVLADGKDGAGVADIMAILGRKESLRRLGGDVSSSNV